MPESWRIHTSPIIGIFCAREFPLYHTLGVMLASWRSVLSFLSYPSSKCEGYDQGKNYRAIRRQSATLSEAAHPSRISGTNRLWRRYPKLRICRDIGADCHSMNHQAILSFNSLSLGFLTEQGINLRVPAGENR